MALVFFATFSILVVVRMAKFAIFVTSISKIFPKKKKNKNKKKEKEKKKSFQKCMAKMANRYWRYRGNAPSQVYQQGRGLIVLVLIFRNLE